MLLRFAKINPNGNITLLVLDSVPRSRQPRIAEQLMRDDSQAEQVGFLEAPESSGAQARLQMMGGEFCGNASMATAAWLAQREGLPVGQTRVYLLEVSGAEGALACRICRNSDSRFTGEVPMPLPEEIAQAKILPNLSAPLVRFPGIVHAILPEGALEDGQAEALIARTCGALGAEAMGFIFANAQYSRIRPLVYVRETQSCVWESGCGSGTAALGAWRAAVAQGAVELDVSQSGAGSCIGVSAACEDGRVRRLSIRGDVHLVAEGQARMED